MCQHIISQMPFMHTVNLVYSFLPFFFLSFSFSSSFVVKEQDDGGEEEDLH